MILKEEISNIAKVKADPMAIGLPIAKIIKIKKRVPKNSTKNLFIIYY